MPDGPLKIAGKHGQTSTIDYPEHGDCRQKSPGLYQHSILIPHNNLQIAMGLNLVDAFSPWKGALMHRGSFQPSTAPLRSIIPNVPPLRSGESDFKIGRSN